MTETFLMLVALWCATPNSYGPSNSEVNKCREEVMACEKKDRPMTCISNIKLKKGT